MIDTKTIETFLNEVNGSIQPAHRTILEDFLTENKATDKLQSKIKIEIEDMECTRRQYGNKAAHELNIQQYRISVLQKELAPYLRLEKQSEEIIKLYTQLPTHTPDAETHPASHTQYGHV